MFGMYRFLLATFVILGHLWNRVLPSTGGYAVFGFYVLSGYLMTLILNERYGFTIGGAIRYLGNRVLRIYPAYLCLVGITLIPLIVVPWLACQLGRSLILPRTFMEWAANIGLLGLDHSLQSRVIPQAWSLYVELAFYLFMVFLARNRTVTLAWFLSSIVLTGYLNIYGTGLDSIYYSIASGSLPFSMGAMVYHFPVKARPGFLVPLVGLYIVNVLLLEPPYGGIDFYLAIILSGLILIVLKDIKTPKWFARIDKLAGDLSYPMYISHFTVGVYVLWAFWSNTPKHRGADFFFLSFGYTLILSYAVHRYIERPIEAIREKIKRVKIQRAIGSAVPAGD
ncbi:MAG: acyltransferase [Deltaproteobacteria bacterium]|nr:acyltransferase [Candidatus Zymogenaceae bacterium]